jgi:hypothetical protein
MSHLSHLSHVASVNSTRASISQQEQWLDYMDSNVVTSKFSSLSTSGCTIVAGADQGQGAWHSWRKVST